MPDHPDRPRLHLSLTDVGDQATSTSRLKRALKCLLRAFQFRAGGVVEEQPPKAPEPHATSADGIDTHGDSPDESKRP